MKITQYTLRKMAADGDRIAVLTCYDYSFAVLLEAAGVEVLLVGDSLGMTLQGRDSTLAVTLDDMVYHTQCVARGAGRALVVSDLPFGSYQESPRQALRSAARLMAAGAQMVKLEGGRAMIDTITFLSERGIPVCGHLGLTPQSVHQLGGYKVQGRDEATAERLHAEALVLEQAGAGLLVLEAVPATLAAAITTQLSIPTIGIGAGAACSGQVLVLHDMLGVYPGKPPKFARNFMLGASDLRAAVEAYVHAVKQGHFPGPEHSY